MYNKPPNETFDIQDLYVPLDIHFIFPIHRVTSQIFLVSDFCGPTVFGVYFYN